MENGAARFILAFSLSLMIMTILSGVNSFAAADKYNNFRELSLNEKLDTDYKITRSYSNSNIAVIAIHGGNIEKGSSELAYELASQGNFNYYSFEGIKKEGNLSLHITSNNFDEPTALDMISKSDTTLSVHGCAGKDEFTYIGGLDKELAEKIRVSLKAHGFTVLDPPQHLAGIYKSNVINLNARNKGVQLEISAGLRDHFLKPHGQREVFDRYINALLEALNTIDNQETLQK
ncbi:hypothetical protein OXPF_04550 [Oxobacter pfennigii]|uniref:Phage-related replication protein n=1 Tax=Oxobacter pfennigii TaxID=36849 RepID=A0A0P9AKW9_9CLOT|nr:poly-gamma-glutamate hydrolase family protein [Oxobacter pfennigii]KPU45975.1 hypothetical protein OXPF_04550 [Oxobacter pfennigii]